MPRIAFIGLGNMGFPMARRLLDAGHEMVVHDLDAQRVTMLVNDGAKSAESPAAAAQGSEIVLTMLPANQHVEDAVLGTTGIINTIDPGAVFIDFSTISPTTFTKVAEQVEAKGAAAFDAAVGPGPEAAADGTLTIMVGGDADLIERYRPILDVLGNRIVHCGSRGAGKAVKIANNLVTGITVVMDTEAMLLAAKAGADPRVLVEVMSGTLANNTIATTAFPNRVFTRNFTPGFKLSLMRKDVALANSLAEDLGTPLTLGTHTLAALSEACDRGWGDDDVFRFVELLEEVAGLQLPDHPAPPANTTAPQKAV